MDMLSFLIPVSYPVRMSCEMGIISIIDAVAFLVALAESRATYPVTMACACVFVCLCACGHLVSTYDHRWLLFQKVPIIDTRWHKFQIVSILTTDASYFNKFQLLTPDGDHYLINRLMNMTAS